MTLGERLKTLRREIGLSQEALGAQGFVSAPGWIKIENNQRQASEKLIDKLLKWLVGDKYMKANAASPLREELLTLKYMGNSSSFVREMARLHAQKLPDGEALLYENPAGKTKPRRGRPPKAAPKR